MDIHSKDRILVLNPRFLGKIQNSKLKIKNAKCKMLTGCGQYRIQKQTFHFLIPDFILGVYSFCSI